jgi:hypothetical protein
MDVQRRKAVKIFASFFSGQKRAENVNRATALPESLSPVNLVGNLGTAS